MPDAPAPREPRQPQQPLRAERKPSDWSPRPIPQPAPERRTADPVTPTLKELSARAARAERASLTTERTHGPNAGDTVAESASEATPVAAPVAALGQQPARPRDPCAERKLVGLASDVRVTYGPNARGEFAPGFADALSTAVRELNRRGIDPRINSGFRTAADQERMRSGASGSNPAARGVSLHQTGNAVDINGTRTPRFGTIREVMAEHGFTWGGNFSKKDPPHFELNPYGAKGTPEFRRRVEEAAKEATAYHDACL